MTFQQVKVTISSPHVIPHLGWIRVIGQHFTFGPEGGIQLPFSAATQLNVAIEDPTLNSLLNGVKRTSQHQAVQSSVQDTGDRLGNHRLPYLGIRLGWTF